MKFSKYAPIIISKIPISLTGVGFSCKNIVANIKTNAGLKEEIGASREISEIESAL